MEELTHRHPETIIEERGLNVPMEETFLEMADTGREIEERLRGEDVVERWLAKPLAEVKLTRRELEEYALSLGEHLTHIVREGWATWIAGFEERAAGLFIAVEATIQQLDRIHMAREEAEDGAMGALALTAFDFVNALGIRSYDEVIVDHQEWMDELAAQSPEIVDLSPLLQFFTRDFNALATEAHPSLRNKIIGQAAVTREMSTTEAPTATEGLNPETAEAY